VGDRLVRELEVAAIRLVIRASTDPLAGALADLLGGDSPPARGPAPPASGDCVQIELQEGPTRLRGGPSGIVADVAPGELSAALRGVLVEALDRRGGALLHGAAAVLDGKAILCIAPSEGGKTTLCGKVAGRTPVLSDETVALRLDGPSPRLSGTPFWSGERLPTESGLFPLAAICFLRKGTMRLAPMAGPDALAELLLEWHLPERPGAASDALSRANLLISLVPLFTLQSTLEGDPLPLLREAAVARPAAGAAR
jgi:hypothetical protein